MAPTTSLSDVVANHLIVFAYLSFLWVPLLFLAFAIGRRKVSTWFFLVFMAAEAVAITLALNMPGWIGL